MLGVLKAIRTTVTAALRKPVTVQYPSTKKELPHRSRGLPVLLWDFEKDEPFCTGCQVWARHGPGDPMGIPHSGWAPKPARSEAEGEEGTAAKDESGEEQT